MTCVHRDVIYRVGALVKIGGIAGKARDGRGESEAYVAEEDRADGGRS
jgi:hypothetical protein